MFCERAFTPCWFVEVQFVRERRGGGGGGEEERRADSFSRRKC